MAILETAKMLVTQNRILYFDYLRVFAITAVVVLNASVNIAGNFSQPEAPWFHGNFWDSISRWCVPVFIMVSGALHLKEQKDIYKSTWRRVKRVLLPFLFWLIIHLLFMYRHETASIWQQLPVIAYRITHETLSYHLWFVPMILSLYILTPVLSLMTTKNHKREVEYLLVLWFLTKLVLFFSPVIIFTSFEMLHYIGYYILGYYLHHYNLKYPVKWYILGLLTVGITFAGTYYASKSKNEFSGIFYEYLSPNVIITSTAVFILFKNIRWKSLNPFVAFYAEVSFGIYLSHLLILEALQSRSLFNITQTNFFSIPVPPLVGIPILATTTIVICMALFALLRKVPYINKVAYYWALRCWSAMHPYITL